MLSLGFGEILVIAALALIVVGPERLPHMMRYLGRQYGQLRRAADDMRRAFVLEADRQDAEERYRNLQERRKAQLDARRAAQAAAGEGTVPHDMSPPDPTRPPDGGVTPGPPVEPIAPVRES